MISRFGTSWTASRVLVDVEGVLLDTSATTRAAWRWWADRVGADAELVPAAASGRPVVDVVAEFAPGRDTAVEVALLEERLLTLVRGARRRPGAAGLVRALPPRRWAIVSSSSPELTSAYLRRARIRPPEVVVTAEDVERGRPHPDAHTAALAALAGTGGGDLAVESTAVGLTAARAAGCLVVAVTSGDGAAAAETDGHVHTVGSLRVRLDGDGIVLSVGRDLPRSP